MGNRGSKTHTPTTKTTHNATINTTPNMTKTTHEKTTPNNTNKKTAKTTLNNEKQKNHKKHANTVHKQRKTKQKTRRAEKQGTQELIFTSDMVAFHAPPLREPQGVLIGLSLFFQFPPRLPHELMDILPHRRGVDHFGHYYTYYYLWILEMKI
ncbi:MAG: hypothetical protein GY714_25780 [Desulfobacterales bacterium]|nr:hypothetical protein [Desulfobacterales bacterium]